MTNKLDRKFTSAMLHLFYQNCYYILNITEQLLKLKTRELITIALRNSSETLPMRNIFLLLLHTSCIPSLP